MNTMIKKEYPESELTGKIIGCAMEVHKYLGNGFQEVVYQRALSIELSMQGIAQKEINETIYWLELLKETDNLTLEQFESINTDAVEIIKLITAILKSAKANINSKNND